MRFQSRPQLDLPDISEVVLTEAQIKEIKTVLERQELNERRVSDAITERQVDSAVIGEIVPSFGERLIPSILQILDSESFNKKPSLKTLVDHIQNQKNAHYAIEEALAIADQAHDQKDTTGVAKANFRISAQHGYCDQMIRNIAAIAGISLGRAA